MSFTFKKSEYARTLLFGVNGSKSIVQEKQIPTAYVSVIMAGLCYADKFGEFFLSRQKGAERLNASVNTVKEGLVVASKLGLIVQQGDNANAALYRFCEVPVLRKSGRDVSSEWDKNPHITIKGARSLDKMVECESMYIGQQDSKSCKSYFDLSHAETNIWICMLFGSNRHTGLIRISHSELAEKCNLTSMTAFRCIDALIEKRLLERIDSGGGRGCVATYMVLSARDAMKGASDGSQEPEPTEQYLKSGDAELKDGMTSDLPNVTQFFAEVNQNIAAFKSDVTSQISELKNLITGDQRPLVPNGTASQNPQHVRGLSAICSLLDIY